jgi:small subunit ribosomal protein S20
LTASGARSNIHDLFRDPERTAALANIQSSEKKNRQRIKREARNRSKKSEMRTVVKKLRAAIEAKDGTKAREALAPAVRVLSRAGRSGLIERNASDRSISRLTRAVNALK